MGVVGSNNPCFFLIVLLLYILSCEIDSSQGLDTIIFGQALSGNQTISSQGGTFELGFFTPGKSRNYYIGIWYKRLPKKTVVWVANRNKPISDPYASELKLLEDGNLVLLNRSRNLVWSTNSTSSTANSTVAMLVDSGNLVVREKLDSSKVIWQSFNHPTDTWLPAGKVGINKLRNEKQFLTSWRSSDDPAPSIFSLEVESNGTSYILLWNHTRGFWSSGEWTGRVFKLVPEIALDAYITNLSYISNENESYFIYDAAFPSALTRFVIDTTGQLKQFVWGKGYPSWSQYWMRPIQQCEVYAYCGAFSTCNVLGPPLCNCMKGFEPKVSKDWMSGYYADGCVRATPTKCDQGGEDTFSLIPNTRFAESSEPFAAGNVSECELACLRNCSCTAYAFDIGCLLWKGNLLNLQQLSSDDGSGRNFHVRVAAVGTVWSSSTRAKAKRKTAWIVVGVVAGFATLIGFISLIVRRRRQKMGRFEMVDESLVLFKYRDIRSATKNFSEKLGEGGFGSVFKGILPNSTAIAVKTLKGPKQGEKQFRAEVSTIGVIQHINLVRLWGFCLEGTERLLVYDYLSNGSLESHLFRKASSVVLDWTTRYKVAIGTARGLAYLHEKCRDCIVHCDIKPENILLDAEFNPKVGDFGLAKLIGRDFSRVLTTMRGTRGYLAPEWISGEAITPKADVFSYGMLLFEIISGKRNRDLLDDGTDNYFPARVASRLNEGDEDVLTLLDQRCGGNADTGELSRACKVACWCIQDDEKDRPTMGLVVQILEGVTEVNVSPIPRFVQGFTDLQVEPIYYKENSSGSNLSSFA